MTNVEKGKLIAEFFPEEIAGILEAIENQHYIPVENKDRYTENWDKGLITVEFWYALAHDVFSRITRQRKALSKSRRFADQLFDGDNALFTIDCIVMYANNERRGSQFYYMITSLFDSDWTSIE